MRLRCRHGQPKNSESRAGAHRHEDFVLVHFVSAAALTVASKTEDLAPRRRSQTGFLGELWQDDSSPHEWWLAQTKPILVVTIVEDSRRIVAGRFVTDETMRAHFTCARSTIISRLASL